MSQRKKKKSEQVDEMFEELEKEASTPIVVRPKPEISFEIWFSRKVKKGEIRAWKESAIRTYFKKKKLKAQEPIEKFDEAFKTF